MAMLAVLLVACAAHADTITVAKRRAVVSANGAWRVVITPPGQLNDRSRASLYRKNWLGSWRQVAHWPFINRWSPGEVLLANDGTVVTFDDWGQMGVGDHVVVIYRPDGTVVRKLGLADLMDQYDISQLPHSTSSIRWSGTHRIDEDRRQVIIQIDAGAGEIEEIPLSLDTGALLVPKRALFPR